MHALDGGAVTAHVRRHRRSRLRKGGRAGNREIRESGGVLSPGSGAPGTGAAGLIGGRGESSSVPQQRQQQQRQRQLRPYVRTADNSPPVGCPFKKAAGVKGGAPAGGCPMMKGSGFRATGGADTPGVGAGDGGGAGFQAVRSALELPTGDSLPMPTEQRE